MLLQNRLYLAQFDAETPYFDLMVYPPQELNGTEVRIKAQDIAHQVARLVEPFLSPKYLPPKCFPPRIGGD